MDKRVKTAYPSIYHSNSAVSSANDSVIRMKDCYQEENRNNNFPLRLLFFSYQCSLRQ